MNPLCLDAACKSAEMTFKQLFDHLTLFVKSPDHRWRLCMRIKRGLIDPNDLGGYGKDQCYFEGMTYTFFASSVLGIKILLPYLILFEYPIPKYV